MSDDLPKERTSSFHCSCNRWAPQETHNEYVNHSFKSSPRQINVFLWEDIKPKTKISFGIAIVWTFKSSESYWKFPLSKPHRGPHKLDLRLQCWMIFPNTSTWAKIKLWLSSCSCVYFNFIAWFISINTLETWQSFSTCVWTCHHLPQEASLRKSFICLLSSPQMTSVFAGPTNLLESSK